VGAAAHVRIAAPLAAEPIPAHTGGARRPWGIPARAATPHGAGTGTPVETDMLTHQALVEYGIQTGQAGGGAAGGWSARLAATPAASWAIAAAVALLGLWLLLGRSSARGFTLTRFVGLVLLLGAAFVGSERLGLTHLGLPFR